MIGMAVIQPTLDGFTLGLHKTSEPPSKVATRSPCVSFL